MVQEGTRSVRFVSVPDFFGNSSVRFGSVWKIEFPGSTWFGLRSSDASLLGLVRFRPVPDGSEIRRFGSVRFGRYNTNATTTL